MTEMAKKLGCLKTHFKNSSGWPDPEHYSTARDLALIARHLIQDFPEYYGLFGETEFTYNKITQQNRNPLLKKGIGSDWGKTGMTDGGGYGIVASAKDTDAQGHEKRLIVVVNGLPTAKKREVEVLKLMMWGLKTFETVPVAKKGQVLAKMDVAGGVERTVDLSIAEDAYATFPRSVKEYVKTEFVYDRSIQAPIKAGQVLGKAIITIPTYEAPLEVNLVAIRDVERAGFFRGIWNFFSHIFGRE
jgi:D-alanyl-D-alanine carboxypeptidase (penicillin-binding protein 5/6)